MPTVSESRPATDPSSQRQAAGRRISGRRALQAGLQPMGPTPVRGARCRHVQGHPRRPGLGGHRGDRYFYRKRNPAAIRTRIGGRHQHHCHRPQSAGLRWHQPLGRRSRRGRCREGGIQGFPAQRRVQLRRPTWTHPGTPSAVRSCPQPCRPGRCRAPKPPGGPQGVARGPGRRRSPALYDVGFGEPADGEAHHQGN